MNKKEDIDEKYFLKERRFEMFEGKEEVGKVFDVDEKISPTIAVKNEFNKKLFGRRV